MNTIARRAALCALALASAALAAACISAPTPAGESTGGSVDFPVFEAAEFSGTGDGVVELPEGITQAMVTAAHDGERYFSIASVDADNQSTGDYIVNALGVYAGTTVLGEYNTAPPARLQVKADGDWTIALAPLTEAPALPEGGTGDGVYLYEGDAATWAVTHTGEHYFSLSFYTDTEMSLSSMLANEVGAYDGDVAVGAGPALVVITADGPWTITTT